VKAIIKRRRDFEYLLRKRIPDADDYVRYLAYELNLEALRRRRRARLGIRKAAASDAAVGRNMHTVFDRATRRFGDDVAWWLQWADFAMRCGSARGVVGSAASACPPAAAATALPAFGPAGAAAPATLAPLTTAAPTRPAAAAPPPAAAPADTDGADGVEVAELEGGAGAAAAAASAAADTAPLPGGVEEAVAAALAADSVAERREAFMRGALLRIIVDNAIAARPADAGFRVDLLRALTAFRDTLAAASAVAEADGAPVTPPLAFPEVVQHTLATLARDFPTHPAAWSAMLAFPVDEAAAAVAAYGRWRRRAAVKRARTEPGAVAAAATASAAASAGAAADDDLFVVDKTGGGDDEQAPPAAPPGDDTPPLAAASDEHLMPPAPAGSPADRTWRALMTGLADGTIAAALRGGSVYAAEVGEGASALRMVAPAWPAPSARRPAWTLVSTVPPAAAAAAGAGAGSKRKRAASESSSSAAPARAAAAATNTYYYGVEDGGVALAAAEGAGVGAAAASLVDTLHGARAAVVAAADGAWEAAPSCGVLLAGCAAAIQLASLPGLPATADANELRLALLGDVAERAGRVAGLPAASLTPAPLAVACYALQVESLALLGRLPAAASAAAAAVRALPHSAAARLLAARLAAVMGAYAPPAGSASGAPDVAALAPTLLPPGTPARATSIAMPASDAGVLPALEAPVAVLDAGIKALAGGDVDGAATLYAALMEVVVPPAAGCGGARALAPATTLLSRALLAGLPAPAANAVRLSYLAHVRAAAAGGAMPLAAVLAALTPALRAGASADVFEAAVELVTAHPGPRTAAEEAGVHHVFETAVAAHGRTAVGLWLAYWRWERASLLSRVAAAAAAARHGRVHVGGGLGAAAAVHARALRTLTGTANTAFLEAATAAR